MPTDLLVQLAPPGIVSECLRGELRDRLVRTAEAAIAPVIWSTSLTRMGHYCCLLAFVPKRTHPNKSGLT